MLPERKMMQKVKKNDEGGGTSLICSYYRVFYSDKTILRYIIASCIYLFALLRNGFCYLMTIGPFGHVD